MASTSRFSTWQSNWRSTAFPRSPSACLIAQWLEILYDPQDPIGNIASPFAR